jgi:hypothetical protein
MTENSCSECAKIAGFRPPINPGRLRALKEKDDQKEANKLKHRSHKVDKENRSQGKGEPSEEGGPKKQSKTKTSSKKASPASRKKTPVRPTRGLESSGKKRAASASQSSDQEAFPSGPGGLRKRR